MPRLVAIVTASFALVGLEAGPALAQTDAGTRGSFGGVALALVVGAIFALVIVMLAYRDVRNGEEEAHQEDAHDIGHGVGADEPEARTPAGEAVTVEEEGKP